MTTTLRPAGPLQQTPDGARSRPYEVRVNSRRVGAVVLAADTAFGPSVGVIRGLNVAEGDRRRGRATVAALAGEEVLRGWGCREIRAEVPAEATAALRMADGLGYRELGRYLAKDLTEGAAEPLPEGVRDRAMTGEEYAAWEAADRIEYAGTWIARGLSPEAARLKAERDHAVMLPAGLDSPGVAFRVLEAAGEPVGQVWVAPGTAGGPEEGHGYVFDVAVREGHRRRGHGRSLMRVAERVAREAGHTTLSLHVFADNTGARELYLSLGYRPTRVVFRKELW
ncbi:GNAT family N-acetyltransferase [Streptomyces sp. BI20]|uniref:GNAT family N-acetyltransferase n=1 Tax=Streptomyces sp. BI20 TaxID=3403460 RepID=UPI003C7114AE